MNKMFKNNNNKIRNSFLGLFVLGIFGLLIFSVGGFSPVVPSSSDQGIGYKGHVQVFLNGELIDEGHNVLYDTGANLTRDLLGVGGNSVLTIAVGNGSTPIADASETFDEFTDCGMSKTAGSYNSLGQTGNWTVTNTFTSSCAGVYVNSTRLMNASATNFAGNAFTGTTLQSSDTLTINWTLTVS